MNITTLIILMLPRIGTLTGICLCGANILLRLFNNGGNYGAALAGFIITVVCITLSKIIGLKEGEDE